MDVSDVFLHARASRKSSDLKEKLENVFASWTITKLCIFQSKVLHKQYLSFVNSTKIFPTVVYTSTHQTLVHGAPLNNIKL